MVDGFFRKIGEIAFGSNNDQEDERVRPASEDPYGDPADEGMSGNVRPASEDPYGDPADVGMSGGGYMPEPYAGDPYTNPQEEVMSRGGEFGDEDYYEDEGNNRRNSW
ncbi:translation initiation factor [Aerosakkonemataceae cyanobacterium BLCC-F50]|uniref:Translation initiation factor n=1 Tax=Floridaenema flaviceps BLCC-F50 TaxID=3153642 RepID=A0ABV4XVG0_9CYAN